MGDAHRAAPADLARRRDIPGLPSPTGTFVRALQLPLEGEIVYVSGITAQGPAGAIEDPDGMGSQTRVIFTHLRSMLDDLGAGFEHLATLTIYTRDMSRWHEVDAERRQWLTGEWPAVTALEVNRFVNPDALIEIEAVVHLPPGRTTDETTTPPTTR